MNGIRAEKMTLGRMTAALLAAMLLASTPGFAEEPPGLAEKKGKWTFSMNEPGPEMKKFGDRGMKSVRATLQEIAKYITTSPTFTPPKGFEARFWGSASGKNRFDSCSGKQCPGERPGGALALLIGSYEESAGKVKAAFNRAATMDIGVNDLGQIFSHLPLLYRDEAGVLLPEPRRDGERRGMPVFVNNGHAVAFLTRNTAPMWQPVSRERFLQAAIAATSARLASTDEQSGMPVLVEEGRSSLAPTGDRELIERSRSISGELRESAELLGVRLGKLKEELASLTPEQKSQQARIESTAPPEGGTPALLPVESKDGVGVVTPDFAFFNSKLPAEAVQLVTIQWKFHGKPVFDPDKGETADNNLQNGKLLEIYRGVDWPGMANRVRLR